MVIPSEKEDGVTPHKKTVQKITEVLRKTRKAFPAENYTS